MTLCTPENSAIQKLSIILLRLLLLVIIIINKKQNKHRVCHRNFTSPTRSIQLPFSTCASLSLLGDSFLSWLLRSSSSSVGLFWFVFRTAPFSYEYTSFHSVLPFGASVLSNWQGYEHFLVRFKGLFFGLPLFSGSVLGNLQDYVRFKDLCVLRTSSVSAF